MTYAMLAIALLFVGLLILMAEVFIPSGGILAAITTTVLVASVIFAWAAWGRSQPGLFWAFVVSMLILVPSTLVAGFRILPHTKIGKQVLLEAPTLEEMEPFQRESARLERCIGLVGRSLSMLNPGGLVEVDGDRIHAFAEGLTVEPNQPVRVVGVRGTRVVVREVSAEEVVDAPPLAGKARAPSPLDFDIPDETT